MPDLFTESGAMFSPCRQYRYQLWRIWDPMLGLLNVIGVNGSKADERRGDHTVTRCEGFARTFGCGGLLMTNLFGYMATDPRLMKAQVDPIGPANDMWLLDGARRAQIRVAAWGIHGQHRARDRDVLRLLAGVPLMCLGMTAGGYPRHPLFMPKGTKLMPYISCAAGREGGGVKMRRIGKGDVWVGWEWHPRDCWLGISWEDRAARYATARGIVREERHVWLCLVPCVPLHVVWARQYEEGYRA